VSKPKALKIGESITIAVGGTDVVLTRVEPTQREYSFATLKDQKSRYEVRVDGVLRGHIQSPVGWGKPWEIVSLGRDGMHVYEFQRNDPERVYPQRGYRMEGDVAEGRDDLALRIPALLQEGKLPTLERIEQAALERKARDERRAEEERVSEERYRRENEERKRVEEERRKVVLEGLQSIRDRFHGTLTNSETDALMTAMQQWERQRR
jgi:hypothetical protein